MMTNIRYVVSRARAMYVTRRAMSAIAVTSSVALSSLALAPLTPSIAGTAAGAVASAQQPASSPAIPPTVRAVVASIDSAARLIHLAAADSQANADLTTDLALVRGSAAIDWTLNDLAAGLRRPTLIATGKGRQAIYDESLQLAVLRAMREARQITYQIIQPQLVTQLGASEAHAVLAPVRELHNAILEQSKSDDLERLRRFRIKYGPGSPHLNAVETLANYALQSFAPFGLEADRSPGPLELVASYATHDFTVAHSKLQLASLGTLGLRHYIYKAGWGTSALRPAYVDGGLAVAGEHDGVLVTPWHGRSRYGAFVSWGNYRAAWVGGGKRRVFISRNLQLVHWLF